MVESDGFLNVTYDEIVDLISSNELNDSSEEKVRNFLIFSIDKV